MRQVFVDSRYTIVKAASLVLVVAIVAAFSAWASQAYAHDAEVAVQIAEAERAASRGPYANDGVFEGSAQGYGGLVTMRVTVDNGYIAAVDVVDASSEDQAWLDMCVGIPDRIESAQTTAIDTVSGATYTSAGMLNAATEALREATGA